MHVQIPMAPTSQPAGDEGLPLPEYHFQNTDHQAFRSQQVHIIMTLRESLQDHPPGEFRMEDLVWTDHMTNGKGIQKTSKLAVILWDRLKDFISGEEHHPLYPCKFRAEVIRRNLPNSLRSPRAHSPALVVRLDFLSNEALCYDCETYLLYQQGSDHCVSGSISLLTLLLFYAILSKQRSDHGI